MNKTNNIDKNIKELRRTLENRRRALIEFDSKPEAEQRRLTDQGLNPHEPEAVRNRKQDRLKKEIRTMLRKNMTDTEWSKFEALGLLRLSTETGSFICRR